MKTPKQSKNMNKSEVMTPVSGTTPKQKKETSVSGTTATPKQKKKTPVSGATPTPQKIKGTPVSGKMSTPKQTNGTPVSGKISKQKQKKEAPVSGATPTKKQKKGTPVSGEKSTSKQVLDESKHVAAAHETPKMNKKGISAKTPQSSHVVKKSPQMKLNKSPAHIASSVPTPKHKKQLKKPISSSTANEQQEQAVDSLMEHKKENVIKEEKSIDMDVSSLQMGKNKMNGHRKKIGKNPPLDATLTICLKYPSECPVGEDNKSIWKHFKECGTIDSVRSHHNPNRELSIAFVTFHNPAAVFAALELDGSSYCGKTAHVERYKNFKEVKAAYEMEDLKRKRERLYDNEIIVSNIRYSCTDVELSELFQDCGEIDHVKKCGISTSGLVSFTNADSIEKALLKDGQMFQGEIIYVKRYGYSDKPSDISISVVIKNVDRFPERTSLKMFFEECGPVNSVFLGKTRNRPNTFGYVIFENEEGAVNALAMNGKDYLGLPMTVVRNKDRNGDQNDIEHSKTVLVRNLSTNPMEIIFKNFFKSAGPIRNYVLKHKGSMCMGLGFINFIKPESVDKAVLLNGERFLGRPLVIVDQNDKSPLRDKETKEVSSEAAETQKNKKQKLSDKKEEKVLEPQTMEVDDDSESESEEDNSEEMKKSIVQEDQEESNSDEEESDDEEEVDAMVGVVPGDSEEEEDDDDEESEEEDDDDEQEENKDNKVALVAEEDEESDEEEDSDEDEESDDE